MVDQIFYLISAVLLGVVIGALIMYFISAGKSKDPEAAIAKVEEKLNNYQQDVSSHFEETADLIDELTHSYKKVFDHLSKSAKQLMTEEQIQHQIEKRKGQKVTLAFLDEEEHEEVLAEDSRDDQNDVETPVESVEDKVEMQEETDGSNDGPEIDNNQAVNKTEYSEASDQQMFDEITELDRVSEDLTDDSEATEASNKKAEE